MQNGVASLTISTLAAGDHSITAFYEGDVMDGTSTSAGLTETITGGGAAQARPNGTSAGFALLGAVSDTRIIPQSREGVSSTSPANATQVMMTTETEPSLSPTAYTANVDAFWCCPEPAIGKGTVCGLSIPAKKISSLCNTTAGPLLIRDRFFVRMYTDAPARNLAGALVCLGLILTFGSALGGSHRCAV